MTDILIDDTTEDVVFSDGDVVLVTGLAAVGQRVRDRLSTFVGEWFLNTEFGPNYLRDVMVKNPSMSLVQSVLSSEARESLQDEAVLVETRTALDNATRTLHVEMILRDPETQEQITIEFPIGV